MRKSKFDGNYCGRCEKIRADAMVEFLVGSRGNQLLKYVGSGYTDDVFQVTSNWKSLIDRGQECQRI